MQLIISLVLIQDEKPLHVDKKIIRVSRLGNIIRETINS